MRCEHCGELVRIQRPLTKRQRAVLSFIVAYTGANGFAPTVREIAEYMGLRSLATVAEHLDHLEAAGRIVREKHNAVRSITVLAA